MKTTLILAIAGTLALGSAASAAGTQHNRKNAQQVVSQPKERLGTLSCDVAGGVGLLIGSSKSVECRFRQRTGKVERYTGTLSCDVAGGVGLLIGSSKSVECRFRQRTGKVERYTGTIGKLGIDVGVTGKSYLSWIVVNTAPTTIGEGSLAGTYVGASVGASLGVGLGANALIGGNAKNFGLQPLSGEAGTGLNVAAGVSRLQLRPAR